MNAQKFWLRMVYLGYISVFRSGVITTLRGKLTRGYVMKNGYLYWTAWDRWSKRFRTIGVHRLVWMVFKGLIPKGMEINHIDNDRTNNRIGNLEIVTPQGNSDHAVSQGRVPRGENHFRAKLTDDQVIALRLKWIIDKAKMSKNEFARQNAPEGVSFWTVLYAINGNRYKHLQMPS